MDIQPLSQVSGRSLDHLTTAEKEMRAYLETHRTTENTRRARRIDFSDFTSWAGASLSMPVPVNTLERYVLHLLGRYKLATVERRIATLSAMHSEAIRQGLTTDNPCTHPIIRDLLKSGRRAQAAKGSTTRKHAITYSILCQMLATCDDSLVGLRDRALLFFAFASGGRRRSEVSTARLEHLESVGEGYRYLIPLSKTDQEGEGHYVPMVGVAAEALNRWLAAAKLDSIKRGALFRAIDRHGNIGEGLTCKTVARVVAARLKLAGLNPALYSAHSLRSGFVTEAANRGASESAIMAMTGHKSQVMVKRYYRAGDVLNNPAARLCG